MITRFTIEGFKLLKTRPVPLSRVTTIVGPNNGGKTSLLQALLVWQLALQTWVKRRKYDPAQPEKLTAKERAGVRLNLEAFTFLEIESVYELWPDLLVYEGPNKPALITIQVEGVSASVPWNCAVQLDFHDAKVVRVRPVSDPKDGAISIPKAAIDEVIVLSSAIHGTLPTSELLLQRDGVEFLIQTGQANRALRSMLYYLDCVGDSVTPDKENPSPAWRELTEDIRHMFNVELQRPLRLPNSAIEVTYRNLRKNRAGKPCEPMNLNTAGSGFLQILQLLTLFNSRSGKATLFLLDEPEAHLESIRQQDLYRLFTERAERMGVQIIMASHSEKFMDEAMQFDRQPDRPEHLLTAISGDVRPLISQQEHKLARKALEAIPAVDYYDTERRPQWLYVEDKSDVDILREWARVLKHKQALKLLDIVNPTANHHYIKSNAAHHAFAHFESLKFMFPKVKGVVLTDSIDRGISHDRPMRHFQWKRREIENYLLVWDAIDRVFWADAERNKKWSEVNGLEIFRHTFSKQLLDIMTSDFLVSAAFSDSNHPALLKAKASDEILVPFFKKAFSQAGIYNSLPKDEFHRIAGLMKPEEVHSDVVQMLDDIVAAFSEH